MFTSTNYNELKQLFNVEDYKSGQEAFNALAEMAGNRNMEPEIKTLFNRNFYGFLTAIDIKFDTKVSLKAFVSEYIPTLDSFTKKQRDEIVLIEGNQIFSDLDGKGGYPSAWNLTKGTFRFPSQWFNAYNTIVSNKQLLDSMRKGLKNV